MSFFVCGKNLVWMMRLEELWLYYTQNWTSLHQSLSSLLRRDGALQDQIVMTPSLSAVGMETRQLTEENADFALRDRYHHSSFITTTDKMVHPQSNWACNNCALLTSWTETVDGHMGLNNIDWSLNWASLEIHIFIFCICHIVLGSFIFLENLKEANNVCLKIGNVQSKFKV